MQILEQYYTDKGYLVKTDRACATALITKHDVMQALRLNATDDMLDHIYHNEFEWGEYLNTQAWKDALWHFVTHHKPMKRLACWAGIASTAIDRQIMLYQKTDHERSKPFLFATEELKQQLQDLRLTCVNRPRAQKDILAKIADIIETLDDVHQDLHA